MGGVGGLSPMESGTISLTGAANAVKTARALESDKPGLKSQFYTD